MDESDDGLEEHEREILRKNIQDLSQVPQKNSKYVLIKMRN